MPRGRGSAACVPASVLCSASLWHGSNDSHSRSCRLACYGCGAADDKEEAVGLSLSDSCLGDTCRFACLSESQWSYGAYDALLRKRKEQRDVRRAQQYGAGRGLGRHRKEVWGEWQAQQSFSAEFPQYGTCREGRTGRQVVGRAVQGHTFHIQRERGEP